MINKSWCLAQLYLFGLLIYSINSVSVNILLYCNKNQETHEPNIFVPKLGKKYSHLPVRRDDGTHVENVSEAFFKLARNPDVHSACHMLLLITASLSLSSLSR